MTAAVGISNFVLTRYPPVLSSVYALAFGAGGIGLFAALAGDRISASAIPMLGIVTVTLFADLLIMRVLDDIRDQDYDRVADPQRPVASGAVQLRDLSALTAACVTLIVRRESVLPRWNGRHRRSASVRRGGDGCRSAISGYTRRQPQF